IRATHTTRTLLAYTTLFRSLHGPNLNLLGTREPDTYGHTTLAQINQALTTTAVAAGHELTHLQSNSEHELIQRIHQAAQEKIDRSEEHTSELQSRFDLVCRL